MVRSRPQFSLRLFCSACLLLALLFAWLGIRHPSNTANSWSGFPPDTPRLDGFVDSGRLTYDIIEDIHGGNGLHARLHVRVKLNHDRVFLHSIENCVAEIRHVPYSLQDSLSSGDPTYVEEFVADHLVRFNGTSSVASVKLMQYQLYPKTPLTLHGIQPISGTSSGNGEPSDAPESASRDVSTMEDQPRGPGDR